MWLLFLVVLIFSSTWMLRLIFVVKMWKITVYLACTGQGQVPRSLFRLRLFH